MGPPGQLFFPSCLLSSEDSRRIHTVKYKSSSLLIKKNLFRTLLSFFHKIKRTYQTHIFLSFNNEICYLNYDTKHFFFFLQTPKTRFSTIFFKPQFSHLFKQKFLNFMTKRALSLWLWHHTFWIQFSPPFPSQISFRNKTFSALSPFRDKHM